MFPRKLIYRKACGPTRSVQHLFVWVYRKRCLRFYLISLSANHGIRAVNFQRRELLEIARHVLSAQRVLSLMALDACALEPGGRFVTERGKKKESRNLNPGLTAWVMTGRNQTFCIFVSRASALAMKTLSKSAVKI